MSVFRVAALAMGLAGCSLNYVDKDGNQHVVGLVDIVVKSPEEPSKVAGDVVDVMTVGLAISNTQQGSRIAIGYNRDVVAALRDNAVVVGNPLTITADAKLLEKPASKGGAK